MSIRSANALTRAEVCVQEVQEEGRRAPGRPERDERVRGAARRGTRKDRRGCGRYGSPVTRPPSARTRPPNFFPGGCAGGNDGRTCEPWPLKSPEWQWQRERSGRGFCFSQACVLARGSVAQNATGRLTDRCDVICLDLPKVL